MKDKNWTSRNRSLQMNNRIMHVPQTYKQFRKTNLQDNNLKVSNSGETLFDLSVIGVVFNDKTGQDGTTKTRQLLTAPLKWLH